jgi:hypothetical protein
MAFTDRFRHACQVFNVDCSKRRRECLLCLRESRHHDLFEWRTGERFAMHFLDRAGCPKDVIG